MPWPMVHFAVSAKMYANDPTPHFLLGSIAPDAIHMREHATKADKGKTHFVSNESLPTLEAIKWNCLKYLNEKPELEWKELILGYFAHIYVDVRWTNTICADFEHAFNGGYSDMRSAYNREMSHLEFNLLRAEQWPQGMFVKLSQAKACAIEPLLTSDEIDQYRDVKLAWLRDEGNDTRIDSVYFTEERVGQFIDEVSLELNELFEAWGVEL